MSFFRFSYVTGFFTYVTWRAAHSFLFTVIQKNVMSRAHSPSFPSLHLRHSSFSRAHNYSHSRAHSPSFPSLHLCHSSFSNSSVALPTSQFILQPFHYFTYVTAHSPTLPSLYLHHSSFSNPSIASPMSQVILQPFFRFSYIRGSFTYITWQTAHDQN